MPSYPRFKGPPPEPWFVEGTGATVVYDPSVNVTWKRGVPHDVHISIDDPHNPQLSAYDQLEKAYAEFALRDYLNYEPSKPEQGGSQPNVPDPS